MSDDIKPALTPEEWERKSVEGVGEIDANGVLSTESNSGRMSDESAWSRHALAALALHGQSFGFTQDDVELLMVAVHTVRPGPMLKDGESKQIWLDETRAALERLADRIAALLPLFDRYVRTDPSVPPGTVIVEQDGVEKGRIVGLR